MDFSRHTVQISETETEFLLVIHASQKERAKTISGYRWDTNRRCWVYPKTARSYDALIEEFGDDLIGNLTITRPGQPVPIKTEDLQSENQDLKEELSEIRQTLKLISEKASNNSEIQVLQSSLAAKESELIDIRYCVQDLEKKLEEKRVTTQEYFKEVQRLRGVNQRLQEKLEQKSSQRSDIQKWIREAVKDATNRDEKFCLIADKVRFNETLPIELVKELETELKKILNCENQNSMKLYDLLTQASDAGILSERGLDFAHIIRKQRNVLAHETTNRQTLQIRILLCLLAAALLWAELAEFDQAKRTEDYQHGRLVSDSP